MLWRRSAWLGLEEEYEGQAFDIRVKGLEKIDGSHFVKKIVGQCVKSTENYAAPG